MMTPFLTGANQRIPDLVYSDNDDPVTDTTENAGQDTGVHEETGRNIGVDDEDEHVNLDGNEESAQATGVDKDDGVEDELSIMDTANNNHAEPTNDTVYEQFQNAIRIGRKAGLNNDHRRPKRNNKTPGTQACMQICW